jgi:hypothetical protein
MRSLRAVVAGLIAFVVGAAAGSVAAEAWSRARVAREPDSAFAALGRVTWPDPAREAGARREAGEGYQWKPTPSAR